MQTQTALKGKLVSTTDMKLAEKLGQIVDLALWLPPRTPNVKKTDDNHIAVYTDGVYYEIEPTA